MLATRGLNFQGGKNKELQLQGLWLRILMSLYLMSQHQHWINKASPRYKKQYRIWHSKEKL